MFIYWGWEGSVSLTEETHNSETAPGLAALASTLILLVTYLSMAAAVVGFGGVGKKPPARRRRRVSGPPCVPAREERE